MKESLLISYGNYDYDGRLRELIKIFNELGSNHSFTRGSSKCCERHYIANSTNYFDFIYKTLKFAKKIRKIDVLILDNRKATIPGFFIKKLFKPQIIIFDCRELYLPQDTKRIIGKLGCFFEKKMIKKSDIIIAANEERAKLMKDIYNLREMPLVYENYRMLEYEVNPIECEKKLGKYILEDEYRIISTSGCSIDRTNDILVKSLDKVNKRVRLLLVGGSLEKDIRKIKTVAKERNLQNIEIIGNLGQSDLKWLIANSHIGIVNYNQNDLNNKYCASGKLYEFIYEGIPVVTTENPPLRKICEEHQVGISTNSYYDGINEVLDNYDYYKENVKNFAQKNTIYDNNERLKAALEAKINALCM